MLKVFESGSAIPNCQPVRGDIAKDIALEIINDLKANFKVDVIPLGSTIKKDSNSYCGDLDIAIALPWEQHEKVLNFCSGRYGFDYKHVNKGLHVCAFGYVFTEDGEDKVAQVDLMFVDNIEWANNVYHSPNISNNETQFKGAHRGALLISAISATPLEYILPNDKLEKYKTTYFTENDYDGSYTEQIKTFYKLYFDSFYGLVLLKKSYEGKTKPVKTPKTVERIILSKNFNTIIKKTLGKECTKEDLNSFESLWIFICGDRYNFAYNKDIINDIFEHYAKNQQLQFNKDMLEKSIQFMKDTAKKRGMNLNSVTTIQEKNNALNEGGNAIDNASPIRGDMALKIANDIIKHLTRAFNCDAAPLGSTGKKGPDMMSGDIDIAVNIPWERHQDVLDLIINLYNCQTHISAGFKIISLGYPYELDGEPLIAQVDLMFVKDIEFSKFFYHSPNYIKNESAFKGVHRTLLLRYIISAVPLNYVYDKAEELKDEYFTADEFNGSFNGVHKNYWKVSFDQENGLQIHHKTRMGKKKPLAHPQTIKDDTIFITNDLSKIVKIILGDSATIEDCSSVESLWSFVCDRRKYRFWSADRIESICERYLNNSKIKEMTGVYDKLVDYMLGVMEDNGINDTGVNKLLEGVSSVINGKEGEKFVKNWFEECIKKNNKEAISQIQIMFNISKENIKNIKADIIHNGKTDILLTVNNKTKNLQVKSTNDVKRSYNHLDRSSIENYTIFMEDERIKKIIINFLNNRIKFNKISEKDREYLKKFLNNFYNKDKKVNLINRIFLGEKDNHKPDYLIIVEKNNNHKITCIPIDFVIKKIIKCEFDFTKYGNLKIGNVTIKRKGGQGGANNLQFMLNIFFE